MARIILYPYQMYSNSARELKEYLTEHDIRCLRVFPDGGYSVRRNDLIVNWGNSVIPPWLRARTAQGCRTLNFGNNNYGVTTAINKLSTFQALERAGISIPEYTADPTIAAEWAEDGVVVGRKNITAHSGRGIVLFGGEDEDIAVPPLPLYVKYVKKAFEYRVHVFKGRVIDVQEKRKRSNFQGEINTKIRSYNNGWVYCREEVSPPEQLLSVSVSAVNALGLDFGAVDVIWNNRQQQAYILEINTAPGLEGATVQRYATAFMELVNA